MANWAYVSKGSRKYRLNRGIQCVIPEKVDQKADQKREGNVGGQSNTARMPTSGATMSSESPTPQAVAQACHQGALLTLNYRPAVAIRAVLIWRVIIEESDVGDTP